MKGLDYAWGRPSPSGLRAQGFQFVSRYLSWLPNGKIIDIAERDQLLLAGLDISLNWEFAAGDQLKGGTTGAEHAREAVRQAKALGYPPGSTIYYSSDTDVTRAQWDGSVKAYQLAARAVTNGGGYRFGIYGGYNVIKWSFDEGVTQDGWQTFAWSGGHWDNRAHVRQTKNGVIVLGVDCDLDETTGPVTFWKHAGGWPTQPTGDDMLDFNQNAKLDAIFDVKDNVILDTDGNPDGKGTGMRTFPVPLTRFLKDLSAKVTVPAPVTIDPAVLTAAVNAAVQAAFASPTPEFLAAVAKAVNDESHARSAE